MYQQRPLTQSPFADDPEQWVELHNRSGAPVVLTGWSFGAGINFTFPATTIPAGDFVVVSNNALALQAKWPAIASKIVGNFSGSIKHGGEHLELDDANGNPVNEMTFANDAPWPIPANGGGSSLELRDPRADNNRPEAWAASSEAARGSWQNYSFTATAAPGVSNDPTQWNEFIFGLLGAGNQSSEKEILIKRAITHAGGLPGSEDDLCRVIAPQSAQTGPAIFGRQRIVTGEYLDSAYASGSDGSFFKYELIYTSRHHKL